MPGNSDLDLLIHAAHEAARVATTYIGGPLDVTHKADDSPVTAADLAVNSVLHDILRPARPDYGWLSEESPDDSARLSAPRTFIVDPIDGTRSFIEGEETWAHSLAVAVGGQITAAVVFLPLRDKLYTASRGAGAALNGTPIRASATDALTNARLLATRPSLAPLHWPRGAPDVRRSHRPSLAYRMALVAEGRYDAMLTFRPTWEWDIAAGSLILSEAGACVSDQRGAALQFNNARPQADGVVAGTPTVWTEIHSLLR
ncbi:3'(2'),5'-bisphosphate nucleotidase CysQ [Puniceibacterium sp. IMCC21224]|uniref:3'(2'),5'-bisphosphate nucleotidase CysQ n=1 Tax=Puniceibacterium sp. IMCC21224 TaxID=1618204 RepID=UPI00064DAAED|nr:3'(2'),5'-bisphosphate nucleotidase CysQ [Puniceibacterium sp. IMCC21224]KMK68688.1 inositol monophosphatase/fructose-1,6-bisphosphatase family protein [Puniceibacterium sp. IMCC21224]